MVTEQFNKSSSKPATKEGKIGLTILCVLGFCLGLATLLLTVEVFLMLAFSAGPVSEMGKELTVMLKNLNEGQPVHAKMDLDLQNLNLSQIVDSLVNSNATAPDSTTISNDMMWCQKANCTQGLDCNAFIDGLYSGINKDGTPNLPLPEKFCQSTQTMNENLCFCNDFAEMKTDVNNTAFSMLLNDLSLISLLCKFKTITRANGRCPQSN